VPDTKTTTSFYVGTGKASAVYVGSSLAWTATDSTPPSVPTGLTVSSTTPSTVVLSWTAATDNVAVDHYVIYRGGSQVGTATGTTYTATGLTATTSYTFTVSAVDAAGNASAQSSAVTGTTTSAPDTTPPSTPTNFRVTATTTSSVSFAWTASTDNVGVTDYMLYYVNSGGNYVYAYPTGTTYTVSGLPSAKTFTFYLLAHDAAGNYSGNASVTGTTQTLVTYPYTVEVDTLTTPFNGSDGNGQWTNPGTFPITTVNLPSGHTYSAELYFYANSSVPYNPSSPFSADGYVTCAMSTNNSSATLPETSAYVAQYPGSSDRTTASFTGAGNTTFYLLVTDSWYCGASCRLTITALS
jgi:chitodextrinase